MKRTPRLVVAAAVAAVSFLGLSSFTRGDVVVLGNGDTLNGTIGLITPGEIEFTSPSFGTIKIPTGNVQKYTFDRPVTIDPRGVKPFVLRDEWYYNMRFPEDMKGVTPILTAIPPDNTRGTTAAKMHPGRPEHMAWAYDRPDGGRGFGFTGGHFHRNWGDENFRRVVVNAILWTAKVDVPESGSRVDFDPADLNKNLDRKKGEFKPITPPEPKTPKQ